MTHNEVLEQVTKMLEEERANIKSDDPNVLLPRMLARYIISIGGELDRQEERIDRIKTIAVSSLVCSFWCVVCSLAIVARIAGWF